MKNYTKDKKHFCFLLLALIGAFCINAMLFDKLGYSSGKFFSLILVCLSVLLTLEDTYYLIMFCFPFASILKLSETSITIVPLLFLVVIVKLMLLKKQKFNETSFLLFLCFVATQASCAVFYNASIVNIISLLLNLLFVIYTAMHFNKYDIFNADLLKNASLVFAVSVSLNIFISDVFPKIPYYVDATRQAALERGQRFAALLVEPNEFSQIVLVAVGFLLVTLSLYEHKLSKMGIIAIIAFLCINGARSNSKSYVLTLLALFVISVVLFSVKFIKHRKSLGSIITVFVFFIIAAFAGWFLVDKVVIPVFEFRSQNADILTGRDEIWLMYFNAIWERMDVLIIGCGANNVTYLLNLAGLDDSSAPHNLYLEYIVQFGIIGIILFAMLVESIWRKALKTNKMLWIPVLAFLITSFGISANSNDCIFIVMLLLTLPSKTNHQFTPIIRVP